MTAHDKHFDEKQAAAVLKHAVLSNYIYPFGSMTSLTNTDRRAWFIDAYAGAGKFKDGEPGSPLIALGAVAALARHKDPRDLRCIFIERDKNNFATLQTTISAEYPNLAPTLIQGSAEAHLGSALTQVGSEPVLTFLDPFGASLPRELMVDKLLKRSGGGVSEVLLNFHVFTIARIGPFARNEAGLNEADKKTLQRLDAFLGYQDWRDLFLKLYQQGITGSALSAALTVADDYRERITKETGYAAFPVDIRRSAREDPRFQLTLFYKKGTPAEYKFADAAARANAKWRKRISEDEAKKDGANFAGALEGLGLDYSQAAFDADWAANEAKLEKEWHDQLQSNIRGLIASAPLKLQGNVARFFGPTLGLASETHLRKAWNGLAKEGLIQAFPGRASHRAVLAKP